MAYRIRQCMHIIDDMDISYVIVYVHIASLDTAILYKLLCGFLFILFCNVF